MGSETHSTTPEPVKSLAEAFGLFRTLADICRSLQVHLRCPSRCYVPGFGLCKVEPAGEKLADLRAEGLNALANLLFFTFWQVSTVLKTGDLHSRLARRYTSPVRFGKVGSTCYASLAKDVALGQVTVLEECWHQASAFYTSAAHPGCRLEKNAGLEQVTVLEKCWDERSRRWPLAAANPQFHFRVDEFGTVRERFEALSSQSFPGSPAEQLEAISTATRELIAGLRQEEAWATAAGGALDATPPGPARQRPKERRRRPAAEPKPLTAKQVEAVQIVGECRGDFAEAARRLKRDRKTIVGHYEAAQEKLGKSAVKAATQPLPKDRRGQENIADGDDRRPI
jgi:hypothetical protein